MFQIEHKPVLKFNSRKGIKPFVIVHHISVGTMGSMYNTFSNMSNGRSSSSHFGIGRNGDIVQYVDIKDAAWTQGRVQKPTSEAVKMMGNVNPNRYCTSIEFEGYEGNGLEGDITEEQFFSALWLDKYIQTQHEKIFGIKHSLSPYNVIGHFQIDSKGKPNCPGPLFPWSRLYSELAKIDLMTLKETEEYLDYLMGNDAKMSLVVSLASRVNDLKSKLGGKYGAEARRKLNIINAPQPAEDYVLRLYDSYIRKENGHEAIFKELSLIAEDAKKLSLL